MRALLTFPILLCACAAPGGDDFPSLLPRAIETRDDAVAEVATPAPAPASAAQTDEFAELLADAREGQEDFAQALPATERAVNAARGSAASSDAWVAAQAALSRLDAARAPTAAALVALDRLFTDLAIRASGDAPASGVEEVAMARAAAEQLYDAQVERLAELQSALAAP